jgi:hypothetical protein
LEFDASDASPNLASLKQPQFPPVEQSELTRSESTDDDIGELEELIIGKRSTPAKPALQAIQPSQPAKVLLVTW